MKVVVDVAISTVVWIVLQFIPSDMGSSAVDWEVGVNTLWGGMSVTIGVVEMVGEGCLLSGSRVVKCLSLFACFFADSLT